jgi:hypothetical protein
MENDWDDIFGITNAINENNGKKKNRKEYSTESNKKLKLEEQKTQVQFQEN